MKKLWFLLSLGCFLSMGLFAQPQVPVKSHQDSWSMVLLPDLQNYSRNLMNQPIMEMMTRWIVLNRKVLDIQLVLTTGDLVDQNNMPVPKTGAGNLGSDGQWEAVSDAFKPLDGVIPYVLAAGNHDFGFSNAESRDTRLGDYFPPNRNPCWNGLLVGVCKATGSTSLENAAYELLPPFGSKWLILSLEFNPRQVVLDWALTLAGSERYKQHRVLVLTHAYLQWNGSRLGAENYPLKDVNPGQSLWEELVYPSNNIVMVISGHIGSINGFKENVGYSTEKNHVGKTVHQMVFNAQVHGGDDWSVNNGGDGWLRWLEFLPDGKTIRVRTYSPLFGISPASASMAWRNESFDAFTIVLDDL